MQTRAWGGQSICLVILFLQAAGCAEPASDGDAALGLRDHRLIAENALSPNALSPNALSLNALSPNALSPNALSPNALDPNALTALLDPTAAGDSSRQLLRYLVSCAFDPTQAFSFSWTDGGGLVHDETYAGMLAIAPGWATGPLGLNHQQLLSACVASRVNYYGVTVAVSSRSPQAPLQIVGNAELNAYPQVEGAFWGNLFAQTPYVRACGLMANAANSRAWMRDCAAGHLDGLGGAVPCGSLAIVGDCATRCPALGAQKAYPSCNDPTYGSTAQLITTALPPAANNKAKGNLALTLTGPTSVTTDACNTVDYTITIANNGSVAALAPVVTDTLPPGVGFASYSATRGACAPTGNLITCNLPDLAAGATATITVRAAPVTTATTVVNHAAVATSTVEKQLTDNTAGASTQLLGPAFTTWEVASANFNGTPIVKGSTIWFSAVLNPGASIPAGTVWARWGTITFTANGVNYTIPVPNGKIAFKPGITRASTTFNPVLHQWETVAPLSFSGGAFLTAAAFTAPVDLPGNLEPVWSTHVSANTANLTVGWSWGAAVYSPLGRDYEALQVCPIDDATYNPYNNTDKAGTPEVYKTSLVAGAKSGGGTNYTGARNSPVTGAPAVVACP